MHPDLIAAACSLYNTSPDLLTPLSGGYTNAVYSFPFQQASYKNKFAVLRLSVEDCPPAQTLGMLEWVLFLNDEGAPVTEPLTSTLGNLLERLEHDGKAYTITAFEKAEGTLAENVPPAEWTDELFRSIGRAAGKLHTASKRYQPSRPDITRPQWFDSYEIHEATDLLTTSPDPAREKLAMLIHSLKQLPIEPTNFGLIHDDLHFANFLIKPDGHISIIDFDDCVYGWFAMDIAMALFDVLVLYNAPTVEESQYFARRFIQNYLVGYRQEMDLPPFWQSQIPRFLKLKELCIYASLTGHADVDQPDSWVGRFMRGRAERVANDIPYVDINFMRL